MMKRILVLALFMLFLVPAASYADVVLIHQSTENFYSSGGTGITGCTGTGCPAANFTVGNVSGSILWEIQEKVYYNSGTNQTIFNYTVFNDLYNGVAITGWFVPGFGPSATTSAPGWFYTNSSYLAVLAGYGSGDFTWLAGTVGAGIYTAADCFVTPHANCGALDSFNVIFPGQLAVGFAGGTVLELSAQSFGDGGFPTSPNWVASSPVPEPGTMALFGTGLLGLAGAIRRKLQA